MKANRLRAYVADKTAYFPFQQTFKPVGNKLQDVVLLSFIAFWGSVTNRIRDTVRKGDQ